MGDEVIIVGGNRLEVAGVKSTVQVGHSVEQMDVVKSAVGSTDREHCSKRSHNFLADKDEKVGINIDVDLEDEGVVTLGEVAAVQVGHIVKQAVVAVI